MLAPLSSLLCRHDFYWSERHKAERCRRCAKLRDAPEHVSHAEPLRFEEAEPLPPADIMPFPEQVAEAESAPVPVEDTEELSDDLPSRIEQLALGANLSRKSTLKLIQDIIEDGQSADPQIVGLKAAALYAHLNDAANKA